ncbi:MAG TPA: gamma-glutamyltransferase [Pseudidiomarina sp.]|nr:gamma-glutamyltransferase [Pseudidiomarina sp.]
MYSFWTKVGLIVVLLSVNFVLSACQPGPTVNSEVIDQSTAADPEAATGRQDKAGRSARQYMSVAATPLAAEAGAAVLAAGGSAIDAAIAVQAMLTLTEPQSSGIGGGAFILYWDAQERKLYTVDARERAPINAGPDLFLDAQGAPPESFWDAVIGGRSVGTPGVLKGLELAHQRWGQLPWSTLFADAIETANEGFPVSPRLAHLLAIEMNPGITELQPAADYFYPNGKPLAEGTILKNPSLAASFKLIAERGAEAFYRGPIAEQIVDAVQSSAQSPGRLTLEDLAQYEAKLREPVCSMYRVYQVCGMGPPSSGASTVLQILGILENFPVGDWQPVSEKFAHHFTQASKLAFADRNRYLADSDYVEVPIASMLDKTYLAQRAGLIRAQDMGRAQPGVFTDYSYADDQSPEFPNTSHISIVDAQGNAVSMTTSIEMGFGSGVMAGGFLLNNQLTDFSIIPVVDGKAVANRVEGGKRPRSSMSPTMIFDQEGDDLVHVIGSPGGARIINYVAQTVIGLVDFELDMQSAIDQAHLTNLNGATQLEAETAMADLQKPLEARGHKVQVQDLNSGLHGITILPNGTLFGGADPRREGIAVGQ